MTWAAIDVRFIRDSKGVSSDAKTVFLAVRLYCAERETDGEFSRGQLIALAEEAGVNSDPMKIAAAWLKRGLWEKTSEGWVDVGFLDINPSHADREKERQRLRKYRKRQKGEGTDAGMRTGSRTPYAYTPTGQDKTVPTDVLTGKTPKRGDGVPAPQEGEGQQNPSPLTEHFGSSQERSRHDHRSDNDLIDEALADAAREEARKRRDLLARAKMHDLASRSPLPVKGLPPQVTP